MISVTIAQEVSCMKVISWNLNGLLSCVKNNSFEPIIKQEPTVVCCQEIRTQQRVEVLPGYTHYWNPCLRDGYSGTLTMAKELPLAVEEGLGVPELDAEGRVLTLEFKPFFLVNAYVPNSQKNLQRQEFRREWDDAFRTYAERLLRKKPVIICGDFNVALREIDIFPENMREYWAQQGYESDERAALESLLDLGLVDAFRYLYPDTVGAYTWWSNRLQKRKENRGWRLDYFFLSNTLLPSVRDIKHLTEVQGSDHCPIMLEMDI